MDTFYKILLVFIVLGVILIITAAIIGGLIGTGVIPTSLTLQDCKVSDWSSFSSCTGGVQTRTRTVIQPQKGKGKICPSLTETISCVCPTTFTNWVPSDSVCVSGQLQVRTGTVSSSSNCISSIFTESKTCGVNPVNCQVNWSPCINGFQTGTILTPASNGGQPCGDLIRSCNANCSYTWTPCSNGIKVITDFIAASGTGTCDVVQGQTGICFSGEEFYLEFIPTLLSPTGSYLHLDNNLLIPNFNIPNQITLFKLDSNNNLLISKQGNNLFLDYTNNVLTLSPISSSNTFKLKSLPSSFYYLSIESNPNVYYGLKTVNSNQGFPYLSIDIVSFSSDASIFKKIIPSSSLQLPVSKVIQLSASCGTNIPSTNILNQGCHLQLDITKNLLLGINYGLIESGYEFYLNPYMNEVCFKKVGENNLNYISHNPNNNTYVLTSTNDNSILLNTSNTIYKKGNTTLPFFMHTALTKNTPLIKLGFLTYPSSSTCSITPVDSSSSGFTTTISNSLTTTNPITLTSETKFLTVSINVFGGPVLSLSSNTGTIQDTIGNTLTNYKFILDQQGFLRFKFNNIYQYINQNNNTFLTVLNETNVDPLRLYQANTINYISSNFNQSLSNIVIGNLGKETQPLPIGYGVTTSDRLTLTNKTINNSTITSYTNDSGVNIPLTSTTITLFTATRV